MASLKLFIKRITLFMMTVMATAIVINVNVYASDTVDLLFTSDLHSYVREYDRIIDGKQQSVGGFGRVKTYIDNHVKEHPETLVLDCGDEVMGTLTQALISTEACELKLLSDMGYDVITYGNHEFDYGAKALSDMYSVVAREREKRPQFVICNIDWSSDDEYTNTLKKGMSEFGFSDYVVIEKNGIKIAVTGCLGKDAIKCAPTCELSFIDPVEAVKSTVEKIKSNENVDMIICLSHSGTGYELGETEDEILAKEVPDLDVIVSGHSHTTLKESITVGNTHIISCGCYGMYVGDASLKKNASGRWDLTEYDLEIMDESVEVDAQVTEYLEEVDKKIDETVLNRYGLSAQQVVARNNGIIFETPEDTEKLHNEMRIGNILSDSYRYYANTTPEGQEHPFDMAVVPAGTIRGTFLDGDVTVSDAFEALSLGVGNDGSVGYPLVSIYLTGKEVKTIVEVDASISDMMNTARLYFSGLSFEYNPHRVILSKTVDVWLSPAFLEQSRSEIDDDRLYHIVTDSYSMSMLGAVTDMSKGLLSVIPKDANGNAISNATETIIYDNNGNELKSWTAVAEYMMSFSKDESGVSVIPEYYSVTQNRKVVNNSWSPIVLLKNSSKFFYIIVGILLLIILLIVVIIRSIVRNIKKKKIFK